MLDTTEAVTEKPRPSSAVTEAVRLLNVHRPLPGEGVLRQVAEALKQGQRVEAESAPAPLRRLLKRLGARALIFQPDVHVYELAVLWELGDTGRDRLDERLKQRGVRRIAFDMGDAESHLAAACAALELSLEESDPRLKEVLMKIALTNAQRARAATYRGRAAATLAKPRT